MGKEKTTTNATPPKTFKRNEFGLIVDDSINYIYNEDGTINWRKMIPVEFLVPNKQAFKNKPVPETIDGLQDGELLMKLGGTKLLAQLRGLNSVSYTVTVPSSDYVVAVCSIGWIPNYETEGRAITFAGIGDAHPGNTNGFGRNYLGPIAENRAFVRCVRNFLKINIVSQEEIGGNGNFGEVTEDMSSNLLRDNMQKYGISFESVKAKLIEEKVEGAENFTSLNDIPRYKQFELIERIKKKAATQGK